MPEADFGEAHREAQFRVPEGQAGLTPPGRLWLIAGLAIVVSAAVPVLSAGFGPDPDSWLVAQAAEHLWDTGEYIVSRFPGYPLHEIASAPLVGLGGCVASNGGTLLAALVLTFLWYDLSGRLGRNPLTLFLSLVCAPLVLANAGCTIDYLWSLALLLAALCAADRRRETLAGICTGLAAGFRPSNFAIVLPLLIYIALRQGKSARIRYLLTAALATLASFSPVIAHYGGMLRWWELTRAEMSDIHPETATRLLDFGYRSLYAAGPAAVLMLAFIVWRGRNSFGVLVREQDPVMLMSFAAVVIMWAQFLVLPLDRAYLLPALPFVLLIADRISTPRLSLGLLVCIASLNVVNPDIVRHERPAAVLSFNIHEGRLQEAWRDRLAMAELQTRIHRGVPPAR